MNTIPINSGEAVFEPFWDPEISEFDSWKVSVNDVGGLAIGQDWCFLAFKWESAVKDVPILEMSRCYSNLNCNDYDELVVSAALPKDSYLRVDIEGEGRLLGQVYPLSEGMKVEYSLPLSGMESINNITLIVFSSKGNAGSGWFNWIGLKNKELTKAHIAQYRKRGCNWDKYIKQEGYTPDFEPVYGILINSDELKGLRIKHQEYVSLNGADSSPYIKAAKEALEHIPENYINDYVNFWTDTRYNRERDHGKYLLNHGINAAIAGLLTKDAALLRLAARFAMSIAMSDNWDDGFICDFPGSTFEHRSFVQSLCLKEVATILDLAGDLFTPLGRDVILRRIASEGIPAINYDTWRHEYIFACNQMALFSSGRMYGYGVLLKHFPRVKPYMELAFADLIETLNSSILPDGGYVEGPNYFTCVGSNGGASLYYYARAMGTDIDKLIPDIIKKTSSFAALIESTADGADVIPICDAGDIMGQETLAFMAVLLPESRWSAMYEKSVKRTGLPDNILSWLVDSKISKNYKKPQPVVKMPLMGSASSYRILNGREVKILVMGNSAGAGHTHEDKGSLVLEYAGEVLLVDPGTCDYANPISMDLKTCQRHNMLIPFGVEGRPAPDNPLPFDIIPNIEGDHISFNAEFDLSPGWGEYYDIWKRTIHSPTPDKITITDKYKLKKGNGTAFLLQTFKDVFIDGNTITIEGDNCGLTAVVPDNAEVVVDILPLLAGKQNRISVINNVSEGVIKVDISLWEK